jgi:hypothetical protein
LNLERTTVIAGLPIKTVRDAVREMNRHDVNDYGWTVDKLAAYMKISSTHAEWLCETLLEKGVLERKPQPGTRWHKRGMYYSVSETGTRFTNATMLKRIDRAKVNKLIAGLLERVRKVNADNNLCHFINEMRLFGSAMDGEAESFGDVDICYVMARRKVPPDQKSWIDWNVARANLSGRSNMLYIHELYYGYTEVMRMLKNGSPYISLHNFDDVIGIKADSIRLFIASEGAIAVEGGGTAGEALSQAAMKAAIEKAKEKAKHKTDKKPFGPLAPLVPDDRQEHGYDWHGPETLSDRAVVAIRRIANSTGEKLDKQALKRSATMDSSNRSAKQNGG